MKLTRFETIDNRKYINLELDRQDAIVLIAILSDRLMEYQSIELSFTQSQYCCLCNTTGIKRISENEQGR